MEAIKERFEKILDRIETSGNSEQNRMVWQIYP